MLRTLSCIVCLSVISIASAGGCGSPAPGPEFQPLVRKVDHIAITCADPEALFNTLTQVLGLPVAWPLSSYPGFTTGGAHAGNVNIETLRFGNPGQSSGGTRAQTSIYGIVFDSYPLSTVIGAFQRRGADPGDPRNQMREMNGQQVKVWTNVTLNGLCTDTYIVYLCEYTPAMKEILAKRAKDNPLPLGGIGLMGAKKIMITGAEPEQTRKRWKMALAPAPMSKDGELSFESGPAIVISGGSRDAIGGLIFKVNSLERARAFLEQKGLLGNASKDQINVNPATVQGLEIRLVER
jgi:hypothetical protein